MPGMPEFELLPLSGMRKVIARRVVESKQTVPHFYLTIDCAVDEMMRVRAALNERAPEGVKISVNDLVIRSEEHTSELQSLMRSSYAVFCLKKKKKNTRQQKSRTHRQ